VRLCIVCACAIVRIFEAAILRFVPPSFFLTTLKRNMTRGLRRLGVSMYVSACAA
jgi:hypothetical protein